MSAPIICYGDQVPQSSSSSISTAIVGTTADAVLVDRLPYRIYQADVNPCQIIVQWSATISLSYVGFAFTNSGQLGGQLFVVDGSTNGGTTVTQLAGQIVTHNGAAMIPFTQASVNWIRITISDPPGNNLFPFSGTLQAFGQTLVAGRVALSVLQIGKKLQMPLPIYGGHAPITLNTTTKTQSNVRGQYLGRELIRQAYSASYEFKHLEAAWYRSDFDPFVADALYNPFIISWRPTEYPEECAFVMLNDNVTPTNMGIRDLMSVTLSVDGFAVTS